MILTTIITLFRNITMNNKYFITTCSYHSNNCKNMQATAIILPLLFLLLLLKIKKLL